MLTSATGETLHFDGSILAYPPKTCLYDVGAETWKSNSIAADCGTTIVALLLLGVPGTVLRFSGIHIDPLVASLIYGLGIVAGAFLLSWAAEVAQLDVSASLAIAVLALIAILPEYAIEAVLAWDAGSSFNTETREVTDEMSRVAANVTGANRLLIGLGWSAVILIYWVKRKRVLDMRGEMGLEITMLTIATLVTLLIFFMHGVHILLAAGLIGLYIAYLWISSTREVEEPDLIGAAALIGSLPVKWRRTMVVFLFVFAAGVILIAAEPFVHGLVDTGERLRDRRVHSYPVGRAPGFGVAGDHYSGAVQPESEIRSPG